MLGIRESRAASPSSDHDGTGFNHPLESRYSSGQIQHDVVDKEKGNSRFRYFINIIF